jgi:2-deoxy-D-gluconate 3-dehydrogenase
MALDQFRLNEQVAVVTGGNRGIGLAIAHCLADAGAHVVLVARDESALAEAVNQIQELGGSAEAVMLDIADIPAAQAAIAAIADRHGRLDILVNNAGINQRQPTLDVQPETYDRIMGINLRAPFFLSQAAAGVMMEAKRGKIVNIASLSAHIGLKHIAAYSTSKGGMVQMTRTMATEWAKYNIQVNAVAPGFVITDLNRKLWDNDDIRNYVIGNTPAGRLGKPEDIAGAVLFLSCAASDFMTGEVVTVDGGYFHGSPWPIDKL